MQGTMSETSATPSKVSTAKSKTVKHEVDEVAIRKAKNGGYLSRVSYRPKGGGDPYSIGAHKPSEEFQFGNFADVVAHHGKMFGERVGDAAASQQEGQEELPTSKKA